MPATYNGPVRIEDATWYGGPREPRSDYEISVTTSAISLLEGLRLTFQNAVKEFWLIRVVLRNFGVTMDLLYAQSDLDDGVTLAICLLPTLTTTRPPPLY